MLFHAVEWWRRGRRVRRNFELTDHKSIYFSQVVSILINSLSTLLYANTYMLYIHNNISSSIPFQVSYVCCAHCSRCCCCCCYLLRISNQTIWIKTIRIHVPIHHLHTLNICLHVIFIELNCYCRRLTLCTHDTVPKTKPFPLARYMYLYTYIILHICVCIQFEIVANHFFFYFYLYVCTCLSVFFLSMDLTRSIGNRMYLFVCFSFDVWLWTCSSPVTELADILFSSFTLNATSDVK